MLRVVIEEEVRQARALSGERSSQPTTSVSQLPTPSSSSHPAADGGLQSAELAADSGTFTLDVFSGNPRVEVAQGKVHLFRPRAGHGVPAVFESRLACFLAVPQFMTPADFCMHVSSHKDNIREIVILRDNSPNRYMALVELSTPAAAQELVNSFSGRPFSSLHSEICLVVLVESVELPSGKRRLGEESAAAVGGALPAAAGPSGSGSGAPPAAGAPSSSSSRGGPSVAGSTSAEGAIELPTCPVCLERLDSSVSGLCTIMCNHTFHCQCLTQWGDTTCPVCRYCLEPESDSSCMTCGTDKSLWICLICGFVGCGRYVDYHALRHFQATQHCFALELETQRVWDYVGDEYVHRVIQNKADGKVVDVTAPPSTTTEKPLKESQVISLEYECLLSSQLESQRAYYEEIIQRQREEFMAELERVRSEASAEIEKAQKNAQKKATVTASVMQKLQEENKFLSDLNRSLLRDKDDWSSIVSSLKEELKKTINEKDHSINELLEEVRDLRFFLDGQEKVRMAGGSEGTATVNVNSVPEPPRQRRSRK